MKNKSVFCLFFFLLSVKPIFSQTNLPTEEKNKNYSLGDHLVYGGNVGLSFGNVTSIGISPMLGYKVTPKFIPGVSATYDYIKIKYSGYATQSASIYGGSVFANYFILENIFAHAEYEVLNGEWEPYYQPGFRYNLSSVLLGGGYRENYNRLSTYVLVLYNVTQSYNSPYSYPLIIRVGFASGL